MKRGKPRAAPLFYQAAGGNFRAAALYRHSSVRGPAYHLGLTKGGDLPLMHRDHLWRGTPNPSRGQGDLGKIGAPKIKNPFFPK